MDQQDISYALAKQVPEMARGFQVATSYGDIVIPAGKLARHLQANMERALVRELGVLEATRAKRGFAIKPLTDAQTKEAMAIIFGKPKSKPNGAAKATTGGAA